MDEPIQYFLFLQLAGGANIQPNLSFSKLENSKIIILTESHHMVVLIQLVCNLTFGTPVKKNWTVKG